MRALHLKLLATGLLTAAACNFIFNSDSSPRETRDRADRPKERIAPQGQDFGTVPTTSKRAGSESVTPQARRTPENGRSSVPRDPGSEVSATREDHPEMAARTAGPQSRPGFPRAIQLAANVQLPAAVMAKGTWAANPSLANSPTAMAANEEIVNSFYRELSERLSEPPPTRNGESSTEPPATDSQAADPTTVVVTEGPIIQDARERANQRFRTLYGNEAYNRLIMNAAIEPTLAE